MTTLLLPPTPRDFEIHRSCIIERVSTRALAEKFRLSQTRVRQLTKRVCDWLAQNLPVQTEAEREQEIRLAQHLAADQLNHQIDQLQIYWEQSYDPKYLRQQTRVITALARLGIVPGTIDSLAADYVIPSGPEGPEAECVLHSPAPSPNPATSPSSFVLTPSSFTPPPSRACSPSSQSAAAQTSPPERDPALTNSSTTTFEQEAAVRHDDIAALNLIERRLLTLLAETLPGDTDRRRSLEQTLANVRQQKATIELRLSPQTPGASIHLDSPSFALQPQTLSG